MKYPADVLTPADQLEFLLIAQEKLRQEHNVKGAEFRTGTITSEDWAAYLAKEFRPAQQSISEELLVSKAVLKTSERWIPDLGEIKPEKP